MSYRSLGLLPLALCVPLAVALVLPDLGPSVSRDGGFVRAAGLSLPASLLTVPVAAVAARRYPSRAVLVTGLLLLVAGVAGGRYAGSVPLVAAARLAQGAGAGLVLPATMVLVWERRSRPVVAVWAGALAAGLLVAMPLALYAAPDRHAVLAPFPWAAVAALVAAVPCLVWRDEPLAAPKQAERGQVVLPAAPAAGLAFLAVVTTHGWSPGAQLVVACIALVALCGMAMAAGRDATAGSPLGCAVVMITTGSLTYPLAGPLAGLSAAGGEPRVVPFAAGGAAALAGALVTVRFSGRALRAAVPAGHGLIVVAVLVALATRPPQPVAVLVPLGLGVGMALAASLRHAGVGAALFGLGLCLPAVLTGQLLVLSLQAGRWQHARPGTEAQRLSALADGYRAWLVVAGVIAVLLALAAGRRHGGDRHGGDRHGGDRHGGDRHGGDRAVPEPSAG